MPEIKLALFDCDGVLVDSEIIAAAVACEMLKDEGIEIAPDDLTTRFAGMTLGDTLEQLEIEHEKRLDPEFRKRLDAAIDDRLGSDVEEIPGAREAIEALTIPVGLCSNSYPERLTIELEHVGLDHYFGPAIFSAPNVAEGRPKPAPDVYKFACDQFGVAPENAIVLEDSVHGVHAAVAAGCRVVGFVGASHSYVGHSEALTDAGAETVIRAMADYPAVIAALREWQET